MPSRSGRPKNSESGLSRERILAAALQIVDADGVEALSMRKLAARLGVDPMAIYHHLPNKQAVISGLVRQVFGEFRVPAAAHLTWQEQVRVYAHAYRDFIRVHPNLILHLITDFELAPQSLSPSDEMLFAALEAGGLPTKRILRCVDALIDFLHGFALAERRTDVEQPGTRDSFIEQFNAMPPDEFPVMRRVFLSLSRDELSGNFDDELQIVIDGIAAQIPPLA